MDLNQILAMNHQDAVDAVNKYIEGLQPNSPQTQLIASSLGIDVEFFKIVKYDDFAHSDPQVQKLRFKYYIYKIQKWGMQIQAQRKKVKRRHDLRHSDRLFSQNNIIIDQPEDDNRMKVHQRTLQQELLMEKKRQEYLKTQQEEKERVFRKLQNKFDQEHLKRGEHLSKVDQKVKQYKKNVLVKVNELIKKREDLLYQSDALDLKIHKLEQMRQDKIENQKIEREHKKQRQHSLQEAQKQNYEKYIQDIQHTIDSKQNQCEINRKFILTTRVNTCSQMSPKTPLYIDRLQQYMHKEEQYKPKMLQLVTHSLEKQLAKKEEFLDRIQKIQSNRSKLNSQVTTRETESRIAVVEHKKHEIVQFKKELFQQRRLNYEQNRQQLSKVHSMQIERYNNLYSRQKNRIKTFQSQIFEQRKATLDHIKLFHQKEEATTQALSKALVLISDPDLKVPIPHEKLTPQQKIAKKKQDEIQALLKSFVPETEIHQFHKPVIAAPVTI